MSENSITGKLRDDLKKAIKAKDRERVSTLRMLLSDLKNAEIAKLDELAEEDEINVLTSYSRRCKESLEEYKKGGREDLVAQTRTELETVMSYLPEQLNEEEIAEETKKVIAEIGASGPRDVGKVMGEMMKRFKGRVDGRVVNSIVLKILQNN